MTSLPFNFPRRVRIRGGEFGASARAMHRKAAFENVSSATIERKTMSTKTKFKRVALVAVAALGIGMVSAVPSHAAPAFGDVGVYSAGTQIIGGQATVYLDVDTSTVTNVVTTGVGSIVSATAPTQPAGYLAPTIGTASSSFTVTGVGAKGRVNLVYTSSVVGTTTITATPLDSNGVPGTAVTKTITWIAGATNASVATSTGFISATIGSPVLADDGTAISVAATANQTSIARIDVKQWADTAKTIATAAASTQAVTVSIAGAGAVQATSGGASSPSVTVAAGTANPNSFYINANGVAGTGTITISVNGVAIATKTVTFTGILASYKLTPTNTVTAIGGLADSVTVGPLDANGNTAALGTYYVTSSNTAVATVPSAGQTGTTFSVTGVAVGTSTITVANASSSPTITKTYTVTVGKATAKTVTISTDKTSYAAGEKITLTVKAVGSDGTAVGDKSNFAAFSSAGMTSNVALQGFPSASPTVALVGGVATFTIYAPMTAGTVTINAVEGANTDNVGTNGTSAAAAITTSFDVTNPGTDAAVDAANAATDAANYAADAADAATTAAQEATAAAQAAQDSADAATAAVVALGLRVDTLMASVRAQLTSLSNLLVRIIKKTKA